MRNDEETKNKTRNHLKSDRFSKEIEEIHAKRKLEKKAAKKKMTRKGIQNVPDDYKNRDKRRNEVDERREQMRSGHSNSKQLHSKGNRFEADVIRRKKSDAVSQKKSDAVSRKKSDAVSQKRTNHARYSASSRMQRKNRGDRKKRQISRRQRRRKIGCFMNLLFVILCLSAGLYAFHRRADIQEYLQKAEQRATSKKETLAAAERLAQGYDYDAAIEKVKSIDGYENDTELSSCINEWEDTKKNLHGYTAEDVTHIFYHTLVVNTDLAFECAPSIAEGFKEWMTTVKEFNKITQTMYDEGYVLCSLYDFFDETYDDDGTPHFTEKTVYLPEGKKPFVLSLDDLSYYHTYTGHGMATKLVLDKDGKITCEYVKQDGTTVTGAYDCVPLINAFMEKHPDGAYRGARGTIALTGYNGVFGYRTDESYVTKKNLDADKAEWLKEHPDYNYDKECEEAKAIADELKAEGWTFASHTWGHIRIGKTSLKKIKIDTEKWLKNVEPIIGDTECIIFAHGQDLASTDTYDTKTNKKYQYLSKKGFHIFLNVDSHQYTMQVHDQYVHGGRRNLDGYRLWQDAHGYSDWTSDLFQASDILDSRRKDMPQNVD